MAENSFDVVVIGGGPGGYVAAIRAAQLGMRTACVEKRGSLGGTCLNVGCIPSKVLLRSSERYVEVSRDLGEQGIRIAKAELDLGTMMRRKANIVGDLTTGIEFLFKKNEIEYVRGTGRIPRAGEVVVEADDGSPRTLKAHNILIATGSEPTSLPGIQLDEKRIVSSTGALAWTKVPKRMVVIGAGVIGVELGSVWSRLGAEVKVLEFLDHILPGMDREITGQTQRLLAKQGLEFRLSSKVTAAKKKRTGVVLTVEPAAGGEASTLDADVVLVAVGRRPYTADLGLKALGVETDERGAIRIDSRFQTTVPGIYAIGDCVPGPMLAHKAEDEGVICAEMLAGQSGHINYDLVPSVVYTSPEVAGVGRTEERLEEQEVAFRSGKFPFSANSRARCTGETDGLVKVLADARNDRLLGVHIVGPLAGDLIQEAVVAMEFGACAEDIARSSHGHPGMSEALKEAALAVHGRPIHT